jgi:cation transport ATPase
MFPQRSIPVIIYGIVGWFAAAMLIRFSLSFLGDGLAVRLVLFAVGLIIAWPTIQIGLWVARLGRDQAMAVTLLFTATAALCDGIALNLFPALYGPPGLLSGHAGGIILFGVGGLCLAALAMAQPKVG